MLIIDAWQLLWRKKDEEPTARFRITGVLVACASFLAVGIPVINGWLATYHISNESIPGAILVGVIMAVWANAIGELFGGWLASLNSGRLPKVSPTLLVRQFAVSAVIAVVIFLVVFFTAQPPKA
jgi:CDP-diglyceride synthetase